MFSSERFVLVEKSPPYWKKPYQLDSPPVHLGATHINIQGMHADFRFKRASDRTNALKDATPPITTTPQKAAKELGCELVVMITLCKSSSKS